MAQWGINLNPRHPAGQPRNIADLRNVRWARVVFQAAAARQSVDDAFAFYDPLVMKYNQIGMRTLLVLNQETFWGNGPWDNGNWDTYARDFAAICGRIAGRYRGQNVAYEIWNESDIRGPSSVFVPPQDFAKVLSAASKAIKDADPAALVSFGGLAAGAETAVDYVKRTRDALGRALPVDSISVHPYGQWPPNFSSAPTWGGWFGRLENHLQTFVNAFPNMPLWLTEFGVSEEVNFPAEQYPMVIKYMEGVYDLTRTRFASNVTMLVWFAWSDVMRNAGIVDSNNVPKASIYKRFFEIAQATVNNPPPGAVSPMRGIIVAATDGLNVRENPNTSATRLTVIGKGTEVQTLEAPQQVVAKLGVTGQWLNIRTPSGIEGWAAAWFLKFSKVLVAPTTGLNIRSGPGPNFDKVGAVIKDTTMLALGSLDEVLAKIGRQDQWLQVRTPDEVTGYAAAWFLTLGEVPDEEPPAPNVYPTDNLNIRSGPGTNFNRVVTVVKNAVLKSLESNALTRAKVGKQDEWIQVETPQGQTGYAAAWFLSLQPQAAPAPVRLTPTTNLNLRSAPSTSGQRLAVMTPGTELTVVSDPQGALNTLGESGWIEVRTPTGQTGWTSAVYLRRV